MRSRPIGYWTKLLDRLIEDRLDRTLAGHGLNRRGWQILNLVNSGARTTEEVSNGLAPFLDGPDTSDDAAGILNRLVADDWLTVTDGAHELSPVGSQRLERARTDVGADREVVARGIDAQEYGVTVSTLETMCRNLGWTDDTELP